MNMNLQLEYLRTFVAVVDTGGFTRAAGVVNKTQSAVSMQIKRLESEIDSPLFERRGKGIRLTPTGVTLLPHARRLLAEHEEAVRNLSQPPLEGRLRFGSPEHYTSWILPRLLTGFAESYPRIQVEMICANSPEIREGVAKGDLDLGLSTQAQDKREVKGEVIGHDPLVWIGARDWIPKPDTPLALAVFEDGCIFRSWALEALEQAGVDHRIVYVSRSEAGIQDAVRAGLAVAPVVQSNVPEDLDIFGQEARLPLLPVSNIVLHRRAGEPRDVIDCFARHLVHSFREKLARSGRSQKG